MMEIANVDLTTPGIYNIQGKPVSNHATVEMRALGSGLVLFVNDSSMARLNQTQEVEMFPGLNITERLHANSWLTKFFDLVEGKEVPGFKLMLARRCSHCERILTRPKSVELGMGPTCQRKLTRRP